jgi:hypothetical protein
VGMANVLNEEKKQQVLALGRLGWSLRRIQQATHVRRETASAYLKAAGIAVRPPSGWGQCEPKPANEVITDSGAAKSAIPVIPDPLDPNCNPNSKNLSNKGKARATSKPANENEVIADSEVVPGASACEPYREAIDLGLSRGRNAMAIWQDLVSEYGFASSYQSVQRFVRKRRVCWIRTIYSASRGAAMIRASISLRTRVISSNFRSKAADIFFSKARSVIFRLSAILAGGLGRAGGRFFGKPSACPCNLARNSNPK